MIHFPQQQHARIGSQPLVRPVNLDGTWKVNRAARGENSMTVIHGLATND